MYLFSRFANTIKGKLFSLMVALFVVSLVIPQASYAQVRADQYQPENLQELIAYLYGIVASLEAQLKAQAGYTGTYTTGRSSVSTLSPTNVDEEEATLRGEVQFGSSNYVYVYFEYGTKNTFGEETSRVKTSKTSNLKKFDATLEDLDEDEKYYYRAVAELPNGNLLRGSTRTFVTNDDNSYSSSKGDYIELDDKEYDEGETLTVTISAPSSLELNQGWVGLYEQDAGNQSYKDYQYINYRHQTVSFYAPYEEGEYEFRLFKDADYHLIGTSESFRVR